MQHFFITNEYKKVKGFTLVEMLVVLGLFSFIMTLATGVLYTTQAINVKFQETQSVLDNVNLSMDTMFHDIRYGSDFHCETLVAGEHPYKNLRVSCPFSSGGGNILFFRPVDVDADSDSDRVAYYASSTIHGNVILKDEYIGGATTTYQITADDVTINSLKFYVTGANTISGNSDIGAVSDYVQPLVTIAVSGETRPVMSKASSTKFYVQSTISSRYIDK